jgi:hypothetical protein
MVVNAGQGIAVSIALIKKHTLILVSISISLISAVSGTPQSDPGGSSCEIAMLIDTPGHRHCQLPNGHGHAMKWEIRKA